MRRWMRVGWICGAIWACDDAGPDPQQMIEDADVGDLSVDLGGMDAAIVDARVDATVVDMAIDAAPLDMGDAAAPDMAADMLIDASPLDLGPDLAIDMAPPDMSPPDMAEPDRCARWAAVADAQLVAAVHAELVETYAPVAPEVDLGGNLNRYTTARHFMFTQVERALAGDGVEGVYTGRFVAIGPDEEPDNDDMNAEHVWPRARMDPDDESALYEHQQSDVHILYPADSNANSTRGSNRFGVVTSDRNLDFLPSVAGRNAQGDPVFEPRDARKGDIARAVLYFSIRWGRAIEATEEGVMRAWVVADPVDDRERSRNTLVEAVQGNRNPFVDCPALVPRIANFGDFMPADRDLPLP